MGNALHNETVFEVELKKVKTRAERWKGLCAHLLRGMSNVFAQYEIEIDGRATPTIETGGLYRCCVEALGGIIASESERNRFTCDTCEQVSVLENNVWKAKGENI